MQSSESFVETFLKSEHKEQEQDTVKTKKENPPGGA